MDFSRNIIKTDTIVPISGTGRVNIPRAYVSKNVSFGKALASTSFSLPVTALENMMLYNATSLTAGFTMSIPSASAVASAMMTSGAGDVRVGDVYHSVIALNSTTTGKIAIATSGMTVYPSAATVSSAPWVAAADILNIDYIMTATGSAPTATVIITH